MIRGFLKAWPILAAVQFVIFALAFGAGTVRAQTSESPFVICDKQRYALCAAADCFVYNGVAYCKCDVEHGDSISLQLSYTNSAGATQNICQVNQQGTRNGYMMSTYSLPDGVQKGGTSAVYTCPGTDDAGSGIVAPVAYGQCDGGFCFESSRGSKFPGFSDAAARARDHVLLPDFDRGDRGQFRSARIRDSRRIPSDRGSGQPLRRELMRALRRQQPDRERRGAQSWSSSGVRGFSHSAA